MLGGGSSAIGFGAYMLLSGLFGDRLASFSLGLMLGLIYLGVKKKSVHITAGSMLMIIQPLLASYRVNFFNELFDHYKSVTVYARLQAGEGFGSITDANFTRVHTPLFGPPISIIFFRLESSPL